jgi:hypothetical protein
MSRNPKKTRNKLKTGLNEIQMKFVGKNRETHANADTRISSFNFTVRAVSLGSRED